MEEVRIISKKFVSIEAYIYKGEVRHLELGTGADNNPDVIDTPDYIYEIHKVLNKVKELGGFDTLEKKRQRKRK